MCGNCGEPGLTVMVELEYKTNEDLEKVYNAIPEDEKKVVSVNTEFEHCSLSMGWETTLKDMEDVKNFLPEVICRFDVNGSVACWYFDPQDKTNAGIIFTRAIKEDTVSFSGLNIDKLPVSARESLWYSIAEPEHELSEEQVNELANYIPDELDPYMFCG